MVRPNVARARAPRRGAALRTPRLLRHAQDGLDDLAALGVRQRFVDLVEIVVLDETIEREAALLVEVHERRDELPRASAAAEHPDDAPPPQGREVVEGE